MTDPWEEARQGRLEALRRLGRARANLFHDPEGPPAGRGRDGVLATLAEIDALRRPAARASLRLCG